MKLMVLSISHLPLASQEQLHIMEALKHELEQDNDLLSRRLKRESESFQIQLSELTSQIHALEKYACQLEDTNAKQTAELQELQQQQLSMISMTSTHLEDEDVSRMTTTSHEVEEMMTLKREHLSLTQLLHQYQQESISINDRSCKLELENIELQRLIEEMREINTRLQEESEQRLVRVSPSSSKNLLSQLELIPSDPSLKTPESLSSQASYYLTKLMTGCKVSLVILDSKISPFPHFLVYLWKIDKERGGRTRKFVTVFPQTKAINWTDGSSSFLQQGKTSLFLLFTLF